MSRGHNFSAGPAALPEAVLRRAQAEMLDWGTSGASVMEVSHRGKEFMAMAEQAEADLRDLLGIPANYKVLFLQGGATQQFAQIPMNLAGPDQRADYIVTGDWGEKAVREAGSLVRPHVSATSAANHYTAIPPRGEWDLDPASAYVHYTPNETIRGVEFHDVPDVGAVPLIADMSSTILSRRIDVSRFGLIYAGAQKNIGPSGLVVLIVREDLLERCPRTLPKIFSFAEHAAQHSLLNTPNTFGWYLAGLVFQWLKAEGGLAVIEQRNRRKAETLYDFIDASDFYTNPVDPAARSWMNVPFTLADSALDAAFLQESRQAGLLALKGHKLVGGMRASLYNAVEQASVDALVDFMRQFARRNG